ncbi:MAG TPA: FHA domain-containing protein [Acidimicrobiales bacterium]|nr:FHA domain-containing protein [Acidimicrobiales bacterium]
MTVNGQFGAQANQRALENLRRLQEQSRRTMQERADQSIRDMQERNRRRLQAGLLGRRPHQPPRPPRRRREGRDPDGLTRGPHGATGQSPAAPTGPYILVGVNGSQQLRQFELGDGETTIGREATNSIVVDEPDVSRRHARLVVQGHVIEIEDLGSTNHTRVNGARVEGRHPIRPGDVIEVANVRFELRAAASASHGVTFEVGSQSGGTINNVGRDQINDFRRRNEYHYELGSDPFFEVASGSGVPRALIVLGMVLAAVGFGLWMYVIFGAWGDPDAALEAGGPGPLAPVGFATFAVGGILASIGAGMARARRRSRAENWD